MSQHLSELAGHVAPNENFVRVALPATVTAFPDRGLSLVKRPRLPRKMRYSWLLSPGYKAEPIAIELLNAPTCCLNLVAHLSGALLLKRAVLLEINAPYWNLTWRRDRPFPGPDLFRGLRWILGKPCARGASASKLADSRFDGELLTLTFVGD
jgi:hypothetical protein